MKYAPPIGQEAQGENAHYIDGNPELGILGSPVPAAALEPGQRELVHVIRQAGLTPSAEDLTQLYQAICKIIGAQVPLATAEDVGLVKPDGTTLTVDGEGTLSAIITDFPIGGIIAFSGTFGGTDNRFPIPLGGSAPNTNWVLCDGTQTNGLAVPDLRGRMILGASDTHQAGDTGGSETHEHSLSGTVGATTLSVAQMPSHAHATNGAEKANNGPPYNLFDGGVGGAAGTVSTTSAGGSASHIHSFAANSGKDSTMPPYYALAYIMRVA